VVLCLLQIPKRGETMKYILWRTRSHGPNDRQKRELERIVGERVEVVVVKGMIRRAEDVIDLYTKGYRGKIPFSEVVVLGPLAIALKMAEFGTPPLIAKMEEVSDPALADYRDQKTGNMSRFRCFARVYGLREEEL